MTSHNNFKKCKEWNPLKVVRCANIDTGVNP